MSTTDVLTATKAAHDFITAHDLPAYRLDIGGAIGKSYNPETNDWDLPELPSVTVALGTADDFLSWFRAVEVATVQLTRRDVDTCVNAWARFEGIRWSFWGSLGRPASWRTMPIRPRWGHEAGSNEAFVTLAEFETLAPLLDR